MLSRTEPLRRLRTALAAGTVLALGATWCTSAFADDVQARDNSVTVADQRVEIDAGHDLPITRPDTGQVLQVNDNQVSVGSDNHVPVTTDVPLPYFDCRQFDRTVDRKVSAINNVHEGHRPGHPPRAACTAARPHSIRTPDADATDEHDTETGREGDTPIVQANGNEVRVLSGNSEG